MAEIERKRNWGKPLAVIALVFGILAIVWGLLAFIPFAGLVLAWIAFAHGLIAVGFGIPGVIGSYAKGVGIVGLTFGALMMIWGIARFAWVVSLAANS